MAIPRTEPELVIWFNNFANVLAGNGALLGFTADETAAVQADAAMLDYMITEMIPVYKSGLDARYNYKNLIKNGPIGEIGGNPPTPPVLEVPPGAVAPGILPRLRQTIQRIRSAPNYNDNLGGQLGITGEEPGSTFPDTDNAKPTFKAVPQAGGHVRIDFQKRRFDGVLVEARRQGETNWTPLGIDLYSPFVDTRASAQPNTPEIREYRLRYYAGDEGVGQWSDIISVTTTP